MKRVHRLIGYLVIVIILFFTTKASQWDKLRPQREEVVITLGKVSYTPYQDEYEKMLYPTVRITNGMSTGSGVIIAVSGEGLAVNDNRQPITFILTAAHVVGNENKVEIELFTTENTKSTKIDASVVITDTDKDLALIKPQIDTDFTDKIYTAQLADKNYIPYLFTPVWAVGCSLGLKPRPSFGHLCAFAVNNWEISAPILPGNSGGPVYDARTFEVIGIAVWVKVYQYQLITTMAGIVPIQEIYKFLLTAETQRTPSKTK